MIAVSQIFDRYLIKNGLLWAIIPAGIFYVTAVAVMLFSGFEMKEILRDPAQHTEQSSFLGLVSNVGIWLWIASATLGLFTALVVDKPRASGRRNLLLLVGLLSLLLAVDDFYLIHERYVDQRICYATYALILVAILVRHYSIILKTNAFAFLAAGGLLAMSILTDLAQHDIPLGYWSIQAFEEGFKFCGAALWLYFIAYTANRYLDEAN